MSASFDPDILAKFDLSKWTAIATRPRWHEGSPPRRWTTLEGSPLCEEAARAGRDAGYLITALQCDESCETLVVKLSEQAREALATPILPTRSHRKRKWYD